MLKIYIEGIAQKLSSVPEGFNVNSKVARVLSQRYQAQHSVKPGNKICLTVTKCMTNMKWSRYCRWWRIYRKNTFLISAAFVKTINTKRFPFCYTVLLFFFKTIFFSKICHLKIFLFVAAVKSYHPMIRFLKDTLQQEMQSKVLHHLLNLWWLRVINTTNSTFHLI